MTTLAQAEKEVGPMIRIRLIAQQIESSLQWQKPPFGWHKCNVDAAFHKKEMKTSAGWCVRDHTGQFVMAGTSWNQGRCSIIEGEAIALLEAMTEAARRGITNVKFAKRQANMVAHKLARAAISWASRYYLERIPTCIETILINEMF
ncbi:replication protein A 70 kDa DNA-binding subunit [Trifolium pratense]|uniref:Replication protein A 70 kDa DNA-binding subunit n=1 Tax=Trifolium pratense TaxID=57577 RepID=A0A2K3LV94_TRIPR|nr:replication protein A 70 kDa DNA-binding subunit [Trifolium pratense]